MSWPVAHDAFAARAGPLLEQPPAAVAHLGIDEHRRGRPRWKLDADTGEYILLADRWHTCFFDLSGKQALLGQVEGRTADDAAYWLAQATPAWRDAVRVVAIDMCSIYASAVRRMLPGAQIAVDLFHVVHLAVKMTGDVRRRVVRGKYGRRGRSGDPEYGIKNLLVRNLEQLSPAQFAKITGILQADPGGQEIAAAWIGKEKLRDVLNLRARVTGSTPCERDVRGRLFAFYDWCAQNDDIPELLSLARTVSRWENEMRRQLCRLHQFVHRDDMPLQCPSRHRVDRDGGVGVLHVDPHDLRIGARNRLDGNAVVLLLVDDLDAETHAGRGIAEVGRIIHSYRAIPNEVSGRPESPFGSTGRPCEYLVLRVVDHQALGAP
jgi:hypothetical protein